MYIEVIKRITTLQNNRAINPDIKLSPIECLDNGINLSDMILCFIVNTPKK